jgi:hypothetical protein
MNIHIAEPEAAGPGRIIVSTGSTTLVTGTGVFIPLDRLGEADLLAELRVLAEAEGALSALKSGAEQPIDGDELTRLTGGRFAK